MTDYLHLTIPEDSDEAEEIRSIDAYNDLERLKIWAERNVQTDVKEDLKSYLDEQLERLEVNKRTGDIELM